MELTRDAVLADLALLPENYKTGDVDRLIRGYVRRKLDPAPLRPFILEDQRLHRIYFFTALKQLPQVADRMAFIHENLLFSDWWHTDQLIGFVADLPLEEALAYAWDYVRSADPFIRRWGYVLFISKLGRGNGEELLPLFREDGHYTVQMAQAWLLSELAVFQPERILSSLPENGLSYGINGKAIQKICDSYRISREWKERFKALRPLLRPGNEVRNDR